MVEKVHGNRGKIRDEEFRKRVSNKLKGRIPANLKLIQGWNRGLKSKDYRPNYHHSEETLRKIGEENRGKIVSLESRIKMSMAKKGKPPWNKGKKGIQTSWIKGKKTPENVRVKQRLAKLNKTGELANNWRGGTSFQPYPVNWNETIRRAIRERGHYTCQYCGIIQGDISFSVHHIDYDKNNCNPNNLITLCIRCHCKTNSKKNKNYWINLFKRIMEEKCQKI